MFEDNGLWHAALTQSSHSTALPRQALRLCCDILRLLCSMLQDTCSVPRQSLLARMSFGIHGIEHHMNDTEHSTLQAELQGASHSTTAFDKAQHFPLLKRPYLNSLLSSSKLLLLVPLLDSGFVQGPPQPLHVMSSLVQLLAAAFPISLPTEQQSQAAANSKGMECSQAVQSGYCWEVAVAGVPAYLLSCVVPLAAVCAICNMCDWLYVLLAA